jgi:hypothetical protein
MADYQSYLTNYLKNIQPSIQNQMSTLRAKFADRGLLSTTAGQGNIALQQGLLEGDAYLKGNEYAEAARQYDSTLGENSRQYNSTLTETQAKRLGDAAARRADQALAAQQAQWQADSNLISLAGSTKKPSTAKYNSTYSNILAGLPIGDPPETDEGLDMAFADAQAREADYMSRYKAELAQAQASQQKIDNMSMSQRYGNWNTQAETDSLRQVELSRMNDRLQRDKMAQDQRQFAAAQAAARAEKDAQTADPYEDITDLAISQLKDGKNTMFGTTFLGLVKSSKGIDLIEEARNGNLRAIGYLQQFWPNSWQKKLKPTKTNLATSDWHKTQTPTYLTPHNSYSSQTAIRKPVGDYSILRSIENR